MFFPGIGASLYPFVLPSGAAIGPFGAATFSAETVALLPLSALNAVAVTFDKLFANVFPSGVVSASSFPSFPATPFTVV